MKSTLAETEATLADYRRDEKELQELEEHFQKVEKELQELEEHFQKVRFLDRICPRAGNNNVVVVLKDTA